MIITAEYARHLADKVEKEKVQQELEAVLEKIEEMILQATSEGQHYIKVIPSIHKDVVEILKQAGYKVRYRYTIKEHVVLKIMW